MSEYVDELILEVKKRMQVAASVEEAVFIDFLDQIVNEWLENGYVHEDNDLESIKEQARGRWEEVLANLHEKATE